MIRFNIPLEHTELFILVANPLLFLVEETKDLASNVLATGLLVVHDTSRGGKDNVTELTRRKELDNPLLQVTELDVVAGRDDTSLVEAAVKLDNNLAVAVVIDLLELSNVACKTEKCQLECCDDLKAVLHG